MLRKLRPFAAFLLFFSSVSPGYSLSPNSGQGGGNASYYNSTTDTITASSFTATTAFVVPDGTATAASLRSVQANGMGIYYTGAALVAMTIGGASQFQLSTTGLAVGGSLAPLSGARIFTEQASTSDDGPVFSNSGPTSGTHLRLQMRNTNAGSGSAGWSLAPKGTTDLWRVAAFDANTMYFSTGATAGSQNEFMIGRSSVTVINKLNVVAAGAGSPVLTSCGGSPSVVGSNSAFTLTGGSASTGCTIAFSQVWITTPTCTVSQQSMSVVNALSYTVSIGTIVVTQTGMGTNKLDIVCIGNQL